MIAHNLAYLEKDKFDFLMRLTMEAGKLINGLSNALSKKLNST